MNALAFFSKIFENFYALTSQKFHFENSIAGLRGRGSKKNRLEIKVSMSEHYFLIKICFLAVSANKE